MTMTDTHILCAPRRAALPKRATVEALRRAAEIAQKGRAKISRFDEIDAGKLNARVRPTRSASLPDLAPARSDAPTGGRFQSIDMHSEAIIDEETNFARRAETDSEIARLTVYVLNAILLIMAFPVGFGMLVFNILGGENLRTTAHAIALTGLAIGLTGTGFTATGFTF